MRTPKDSPRHPRSTYYAIRSHEADISGRQKRRFVATGSHFLAKARPPHVFWANFGSKKRSTGSYIDI